MKLTTLILGSLAAAAVALSAPATTPVAATAKVAVKAPTTYLVGQPFEVTLTYSAPDEAVALESYRLGAGAFSVGGKPLGPRGEGALDLPKGSELSFSFDLAPALESAGVRQGFKLATLGSDGDVAVSVMRAAAAELNFMDPESVATADLASYRVLLHTNRGDMIVEMYPHLAPNHVRNFLDLSHTGFYDGVKFHRVIPGFMIQGGDPTGTGSGNGPRTLKAEFSSEPHVRGILSAARTNDPNSASCQFFVMHSAYPSLDNKYSVFGKLESGYDVLDAIVTSKTGPGNAGELSRPVEDQQILSATVLAPQ